MDRRELLTALGAGAVGVATLSRETARGQEEHAHHQRDKVHEDCMKACIACARACNETARHCLEQLAEGSGDRKIHAQVHGLAMDCGAFCALSTALMERGGTLMQYACGACADACRTCAEACDKHPASEMVKHCAESCRTCERSCREMVKSMRGRTT
jgi:hypothetical protein